MTDPTPGWYPDPWIPEQLRWWDGHRWTHETQPEQVQTHRWPGVWR